MQQLSELIRNYEYLNEQKKEIAAQLKRFEEQTDAAKAAVITGMLDIAESADVDVTVAVDGRKYSIQTKDFFGIPADKKDEAFQQLRETGLGGLIVEKVDPRTLTKTLREIQEVNQGVFPDDYTGLLGTLNQYSETVLYSRKV